MRVAVIRPSNGMPMFASPNALQTAVNEWLGRNSHVTFIDIKYQTATSNEMVYYSAMVIYK